MAPRRMARETNFVIETLPYSLLSAQQLASKPKLKKQHELMQIARHLSEWAVYVVAGI
jgi:hypothetical protein